MNGNDSRVNESSSLASLNSELVRPLVADSDTTALLLVPSRTLFSTAAWLIVLLLSLRNMYQQLWQHFSNGIEKTLRLNLGLGAC